ncbi:MAG: hypothetical protein JNK21_08380 [Rhodospirillaceae bacterium]|nr:hypothetical protein [Rhodospirillaceae bacterium]
MPAQPLPPVSRAPAAVLIAAPLLAVLFMALHPSVQAHSTTEAFAEMAREASVNHTVHSILIALIALQVLGFWGFVRRHGPAHVLIIAGYIAFVLGALAQFGAGVVNGLAVTSFQLRFTTAPVEQMELARIVLSFAWALNQALAQVGVVAASTAVLCWSVKLLHADGLWRGLGVLGLFVGVIPAAGVLSGLLSLNVLGFGAFVLLQAVWTVGVGVALWRDSATTA